MAKLTRAQRADIEGAMTALNRLIRAIEAENVAFCHKGLINNKVQQNRDFRNGIIVKSKDYKGRDGSEWTIDFVETLTPMDKGLGSDLVARYDVKKYLERLLAG